jgi:hypothetical protein
MPTLLPVGRALLHSRDDLVDGLPADVEVLFGDLAARIALLKEQRHLALAISETGQQIGGLLGADDLALGTATIINVAPGRL